MLRASNPHPPAVHSSFQSLTHRRHLHLPPLPDLESYILEPVMHSQLESAPTQYAADHFLNVLPDISEAIASYLRAYPDQVKSVWMGMKPLLKEMRKRNRLYGRGIIRPQAPVCPKKNEKWTNVHGEEMGDDYNWLRDKDDPEVMKYLDSENKFVLSHSTHTRSPLLL